MDQNLITYMAQLKMHWCSGLRKPLHWKKKRYLENLENLKREFTNTDTEYQPKAKLCKLYPLSHLSYSAEEQQQQEKEKEEEELEEEDENEEMLQMALSLVQLNNITSTSPLHQLNFPAGQNSAKEEEKEEEEEEEEEMEIEEEEEEAETEMKEKEKGNLIVQLQNGCTSPPPPPPPQKSRTQEAKKRGAEAAAAAQEEEKKNDPYYHIKVRSEKVFQCKNAYLAYYIQVEYPNYKYARSVTLEQQQLDCLLPFFNLLPKATRAVRRFLLKTALKRSREVRSGAAPLLLDRTAAYDAEMKRLNIRKSAHNEALYRGYRLALAEKSAGRKMKDVQVMAVLRQKGKPKAARRAAFTRDQKQQQQNPGLPQYQVVLGWKDRSILLVELAFTPGRPEEQERRQEAILDVLLKRYAQSVVMVDGSTPKMNSSRAGQNPLKVHLDMLVEVAKKNTAGQQRNEHAWLVDEALDPAGQYDVFLPPDVEHTEARPYEEAAVKAAPWFSCAICGSHFFTADLEMMRHLFRLPNHHCAFLAPKRRKKRSKEEEEEEEKSKEEDEEKKEEEEKKEGEDKVPKNKQCSFSGLENMDHFSNSTLLYSLAKSKFQANES